MPANIKRFVEKINIPYLLHFTRLSNLESIIKNGLYPKENLGELEHIVVVNDKLRLDYHPEAISISISFPNHRMFYKYRLENPDEEWVVLVIGKEVLWECNCAFCMHNAADSRIAYMFFDDLKGVEALRCLFEEIEGVDTRDEQKLKSYDPTDPQAEVLVLEKIPKEYIRCVVFSNKAAKEDFVQNNPEMKADYHALNKKFFASRSYVRKYVD